MKSGLPFGIGWLVALVVLSFFMINDGYIWASLPVLILGSIPIGVIILNKDEERQNYN